MGVNPVRRRPAFFMLIAVLHALLASLLFASLALGTGAALFLNVEPVRPTFGELLLGLFLVLCVQFIAVMAISFLAQTVNALTLVARSVNATATETLGTLQYSGRYIELLPRATTPWSRFWVSVQKTSWLRWRNQLAILALVLVPFFGLLAPPRVVPGVFVPIALLLVAASVACVVWQARQRDNGEDRKRGRR